MNKGAFLQERSGVSFRAARHAAGRFEGASAGRRIARAAGRGLVTWTLLATLLPLPILHAAAGEAKRGGTGGLPVRVGVAYFYPVEDSRNIRTVNLDAYYLVKELETVNLSIHAGITATIADGDITQLEGDLNQGTLRVVNRDSEAAGIGPGILLTLPLLRVGMVSLQLDGSASLILYNRRFPAGGDLYNFMERLGPVLTYRAGDSQDLGLAFLWMHVSNGQGMGPQNPSYDARGFSLRYSFHF